MPPAALHMLSALEQASLVRAGAISCVELVGHHLERIHALNPGLSAFVTVFDGALATARKKDRLRRRCRDDRPPFHGVPIGIKDLNIVRFATTRYGSRAVPHLALPFDDATVQPLRRAGFVIVGKLSTSELGAMPVTEPDTHPPTRNPWDSQRSAGGSSGGSGAALASAMLPVAQGSDGGGSIRIPSSFCGVYGLKPSRGRLPNQFRLPDRRILYTSGPMSRTVSDAAALLDVMAGINTGRTHWAPPPGRPFAERRGLLTRLRVKVVTSSPLATTDPDVIAAVRRTARLIERMGHVVEEAELPACSMEEFVPLWQRLIGGMPLVGWHKAQPITRWLHQQAKRLRGADVDALYDRLVDRFAPVLATADIWLTPTVPTTAPALGSFAHSDPGEAFAAAATLAAFTGLVNLTGLPAANLPAGLSASGLPIGIQLIGGMFGEEDLLALSWDLEEAQPWRLVAPGFGADGPPRPDGRRTLARPPAGLLP